MDLLIGHLIGDYLLQNDWMSLNKTKRTWLGFISCFIHSLIYTISICVVTWDFNIWWTLIIFNSHFYIDRYGLANKYITKFKGIGIPEFLKQSTYTNINGSDCIQASFIACVYIIVDNSLHLVLMYYGRILLYGLY